MFLDFFAECFGPCCEECFGGRVGREERGGDACAKGADGEDEAGVGGDHAGEDELGDG